MTYSSFSKTLAPGIRLGWLHAGSFYTKSERVRFALGRSVSPIYQELVLKLLQGNSYERHLRVFRKKLNKQAVQVLDILRKSFPEGSYFHRPRGGYSIWGKLPENTDMKKDSISIVKSIRFCLLPGNTFSFTDRYHDHFRIVFAERITSESIVLLKKCR